MPARRPARVLPVALPLALVQCFPVSELGDCADRSGMYAAHQVCMPLAGEDIELTPNTYWIERGDLDGQGLENDLATLGFSDVGSRVSLVTDLGAATPRVRTTELPGKFVTAITPAPLFGGATGQDIAAMVYGVGDPPDKLSDVQAWLNEPGKPGVALLLPNVGGELDLAGASTRVLARLTLGDAGDEFVLSVCQRPNTVLSTMVGELERPALVMTCTNSPSADPAMPGSVDLLPDVGYVDIERMVGAQPDFFFGITDPTSWEPRASAFGDFNGDGFVDVALAVALTKEDDLYATLKANDKVVIGFGRATGAPPDSAATSTVYLDQGQIAGLHAADLDGNGVAELVAVHLDGSYISVLQQTDTDSRDLAAIEAFPGEVRKPIDVAIGDFTRDGALDLAVAHFEDDGSHWLSVFVRHPDQGPHEFGYTRLPALELDTEAEEYVIGLQALDVDDDGDLDLAALYANDKRSWLRAYLTRPPR